MCKLCVNPILTAFAYAIGGDYSKSRRDLINRVTFGDVVQNRIFNACKAN